MEEFILISQFEREDSQSKGELESAESREKIYFVDEREHHGIV